MNIDNLVIEVTRRCNMACGHCLRGDAQGKDITPQIIKKAIEGLDYISTVTFSGGEPGLNPGAIFAFIDACKNAGVVVGSFYVATNGKIATDEFIRALMELYLFCDDNEISQVAISRSDEHGMSGQDPDAIERLKCLRFAEDRNYLKYDNYINEGRAVELNELNGTIDTARNLEPDTFEIDEYGISDGTIYINVNGDIIPGCDFSYESQEKLKLGNVSERGIVETITEHERTREHEQALEVTA